MERITYVNPDDVELVKEALNDVMGKGTYMQYLHLLPMPDVYEKLYQVENIECDLGYDVSTLVQRYKDLQQVVRAMLKEFNMTIIVPTDTKDTKDPLAITHPIIRQGDKYIFFERRGKDVLEELKDEHNL